MAEVTGIEWTDHTFNPWIGCTAISAACNICYAETLVKRWGGDFATRRRTAPSNWKQPIKWNKAAETAGVRRRVFCASLADVFDNQAPEEWRVDLWALIRATPWLQWQLLTKRPQSIRKMLPPDWGHGFHNVWIGTTVEDREQARIRMDHLRAIPTVIRFLSVEPLLEGLGSFDLSGVDWVIVGGASGPEAKPMHPDWARNLRDQCAAAGVPFFFKQWGEYHPADQTKTLDQIIRAGGMGTPLRDGRAIDIGDQWTWRIGKKSAGSLLDGVAHKEFPA